MVDSLKLVVKFLTLLPRSVKAYWNSSIRNQLVLSFSFVSLMLMLSFSALMYEHQRDFLYETSTNRAISLAHTLASSSTPWVLADDVAGLQEVLAGFANTSDLKFALVLSLRGEVLGATDTAQIGRFVDDKVSLRLLESNAEQVVLINQRAIVDVAQPIMAGDRLIGWARVEISRASSNSNLQILGWAGLGFASLAVAVSFIIAMMLANRLTRNLYHLMFVTKTVTEGQRDIRSKITGNDEVGQLAHRFNSMLDTLSDSEVKLSRINRLYAAWTKCSEITVQENDESTLLNKISHTLADRVPFELVWIGVPKQDGWVNITACAGLALDYLADIKISVDAERVEGQGPLGTVIRDGTPKIYNDYLNAPESALWGDRAAKHHFYSAASFPIFRSGKCYGGIAVYSAELGYFTPELISLMVGLSEDVSFALTNLDLEQQRLADMVNLERAAKVFEYSKEGILVADSHNNIISVNRSFTDITGYSAEDVIGENPRILSSGRHDADYYNRMWSTLLKTGSWQGEIWNRRKNGEIHPEAITLISVKDDNGVVLNYISIFSDISERKLAEDRIQQLAHYDVLTGLPNRVLFNDRLEQALISAQRNKSTLALLFLDLDRFKNINDTLGHDAGDQLLKMVAERLMECVREQDTVSRQGGDEFIIVLPNTNIDGAEMVAAKMLGLIMKPYAIAAHELRISASIGIAMYPDNAIDAETLIKHADVAMYQAKEGGRNKYLRFDSSMNGNAYERLTLESNLRVALERKQFELHYQPQVDLTDNSIIGCEALIRWCHPELGMISPASFIPLAEETGLIGPISNWVLEEAIHQCQIWRKAGLPEVKMAVNLSSLQFREGSLQGQVSHLLDKYSVPAEFLDLELTEGILMQGVERTLITLRELTALGVGISIDDFGTGYSSLSYLKRFPIHKLKIDQSFVRDVTVDSNDASMVQTIIVMAHSLKLDVIAEGVETKAQADFLRNAGCELVQGYLFGRPMPAEAFAEELKKNGRGVG
ncbi:cyclic di-GMP phosphodiesterase Gmr [mine drainage metagenome]|uniref:Cyclic di-GMP phosphodiesterase Gmr n=1 Tax=mine drainage metagenome TaxID=410659 RepID=A0A1J5U014_9ZZZZ